MFEMDYINLKHLKQFLGFHYILYIEHLVYIREVFKKLGIKAPRLPTHYHFVNNCQVTYMAKINIMII